MRPSTSYELGNVLPELNARRGRPRCRPPAGRCRSRSSRRSSQVLVRERVARVQVDVGLGIDGAELRVHVRSAPAAHRYRRRCGAAASTTTGCSCSTSCARSCGSPGARSRSSCRSSRCSRRPAARRGSGTRASGTCSRCPRTSSRPCRRRTRTENPSSMPSACDVDLVPRQELDARAAKRQRAADAPHLRALDRERELVARVEDLLARRSRRSGWRCRCCSSRARTPGSAARRARASRRTRPWSYPPARSSADSPGRCHRRC